MSFSRVLRERAGRTGRRIAFPEAWDGRIRQAAAALGAAGIVRPVLVGDPDRVSEALAAAGQDPAHVEILKAAEVEVPAPDQDTRLATLTACAMMLAEGRLDGVVAGADLQTAQVVRAGLKQVGLREGLSTLSSSFYMEVRDFRGQGTEVLTFTDAGVVPDPDEEQLAEIAFEAARARPHIVGDEPRVAFLSFSTSGSADGASVRTVRAALERFRAMAPHVPADGELQADAALVPEVAARKAPHSAVAGTANVLVFPDLDAGNIGYKLVERLAGATALGPILQGLRRPLNDLSRGASVDDVMDVAAITALMGEGPVTRP